MMLCRLLEDLDCTLVQGRSDIEVNAICCDSRSVTPGCVFVCLPGQHTDGRRFAPAAAAAGAAVLVYEDALPDPPPGPALVRVEPGKARRVLAQMAVRLVPRRLRNRMACSRRAMVSASLSRSRALMVVLFPARSSSFISVRNTSGKARWLNRCLSWNSW